MARYTKAMMVTHYDPLKVRTNIHGERLTACGKSDYWTGIRAGETEPTRLRNPKTMKRTTDRALVTCKLCLRTMP